MLIENVVVPMHYWMRLLEVSEKPNFSMVVSMKGHSFGNVKFELKRTTLASFCPDRMHHLLHYNDTIRSKAITHKSVLVDGYNVVEDELDSGGKDLGDEFI